MKIYFKIQQAFFCIAFVVFAILTQSCHSAHKLSANAVADSSIVFEPDGLYASTRIPALVITPKGTLLAFCEGRIGTASDWADMNFIVRRSTDGGKTWGPIQIIDSKKGGPAGNPAPIVDDKGNIHLLYQKDYAEAFYTYSDDDGLTWKKAADITDVFNQFKSEYNWKVLATGPGHGIQLKNGRLLSAVWLANSSRLCQDAATDLPA